MTCPGLPPAPASASFDFEDCKDMLADDECDAKCANGYDGEVTATCRADGSFAIEGTCQLVAEDDDRQNSESSACQHRVG